MYHLRSLMTHQLLRAGGVVYAGSMVANVAAWLYHVLVGRILGAERYGELAALLSLFYLVNVPSGVLQTILVKFFSIFKARDATGQARHLFERATIYLVAALALGGVILSPLVSTLAGFLHIQNRWYFFFLYFIFATFIVSVVNTSLLQGYQRFIAVSIFTNLGAVLRLLLSLPAAAFGVGWTLVANIAANVVSYLLLFAPMQFLFRQKAVVVTITKEQALGYSFSALLATLGITALFSVDVILVKHYFSSLEAGIYSALSILGKVVYYASFAVSFVLYPVLAERAEQRRDHRRIVWAGLSFIGVTAAAITAIYALFPSWVIVPFGPAYKSAVPYLGSFALFISFFSLANILVMILLALDARRVWILSVAASLAQATMIVFFHASLHRVIVINTAVCAGLFGALLLYYLYVSRQT